MNNSDNKDSNLDSQRCHIYDINEKLSNACNDGYNAVNNTNQLIKIENYCYSKYTDVNEITSCEFGKYSSYFDTELKEKYILLKDFYNP